MSIGHNTSPKDRERERLRRQVNRFLFNGGIITHHDPSETALTDTLTESHMNKKQRQYKERME